MRRDWKPYYRYLNVFFNNRFVEQRDTIESLTNKVNKLSAMITRIKNSKITYLNDDGLIKGYKAKMKTYVEQKSILKGKQDRLVKYSMTVNEVNELTLAISNSLINHIIRGKEYKFPSYMGSLYLKFVKSEQRGFRIDWDKSLANHKKLTEQYAPVIYDKFFIQKTISRREYYKLAKPLIEGHEWQHLVQGTDWLFLRWQPNYRFMRGIGNNYIFRFTAFNNVVKDGEVVSNIGNLLQLLDTPEKILAQVGLGNINKAILIQYQNTKYKYKFIEI